MALTLLLDFDGTLSDPLALFERYSAALTEEFHTAHGGDEEAWLSLIRAMLIELTQDFATYFSENPYADYRPYMNSLYTRSAQAVCQHIGAPPPADPIRFARDAQNRALRRCNAFYNGAAETISLLHERGFRIVMASGQDSEFLQSALTGAGVSHIPQGWFGPDLVNCPKESPRYFQRIFNAIGVAPSQAVVVDDLASATLWAEEAGARAVQAQFANSQPRETTNPHRPILTRWRDFPALLEGLL